MTEFEIEDKLVECDYLNEAENCLKALGELHFCDEKIDDGCNEGEDEYVMMRSYDLNVGRQKFYVRLYYGNNTTELGTFDVSQR